MRDDELRLIFEIEQTMTTLLDNGVTEYNDLYNILEPLYRHKTIKCDDIADTYKLPYDGYTNKEYKELLK